MHEICHSSKLKEVSVQKVKRKKYVEYTRMYSYLKVTKVVKSTAKQTEQTISRKGV